MVEEVLKAIEDAFHPAEVDQALNERAGRVFGSVTVKGSAVFDGLDDIRRQQLLWRQLRQILGEQATQVGPIVLEPSTREFRAS